MQATRPNSSNSSWDPRAIAAAAASGPWAVDLSSMRGILQLAGPDAPKLVQGLITNDIVHLTSARASLAAGFLTNKGRLITESVITIATDAQEAPHGGPDKFLLDVPVEVKDALLRHLRLFKLRAKVVITDLSATAKVCVVVGGQDEQDLDQVKQRWTAQGAEVLGLGPDPRVLVAASQPHPLGVRAIVVPSSSSSSSSSADAAQQPIEAYETLRFLHGIAEGPDLIEKLPSECNLDLTHAIHFQKGCYLGQELTARTQFKGVIRKRLLPFFLSSSQPQDAQAVEPLTTHLPSPDASPFTAPWLATTPASSSVKGADVVDEATGKSVGTVISVAKGSNLGLALLRLEPVLAGRPLVNLQAVVGEEKQGLTAFLPAWWPAGLDLRTGKVPN